jgi:uncharacterized protein YbaA (DUF1428 family)
MARYVDGFVVPVPKKKLSEYRKMARKAATVWRDHGALEYREAVADDVKPGKYTSFPQSVKLKGERDRDLRLDRLQVAQGPRPRQRGRHEGQAARLDDGSEEAPFDGKRMFWGGFKTFVEK